MNTDQLIVGMSKALEMWTLQNVCNGAIIIGFLVLALVAGNRGIYHEYRYIG